MRRRDVDQVHVLGEGRDVEPLMVHGNGNDPRSVRMEEESRTRIAGVFHRDSAARLEQDARDEVESTLGAVRHHDVLGPGANASRHRHVPRNGGTQRGVARGIAIQTLGRRAAPLPGQGSTPEVKGELGSVRDAHTEVEPRSFAS